MVLSCQDKGIDGPAILQLHKWDPCQSQLNLSEFREAFISPTRELLLLLSYQYEAFLLPLIAGEISNKEDPERRFSESLPFRSPESASSSDLSDNIPSTSESIKVVSDSDFSLECSSTRSKHSRILCDVKSLAWGHCGDAYNQREGDGFKELLFVSGDHGITVHAFRQLNVYKETSKPSPESVAWRGKWVEWGPPTIDDGNNGSATGRLTSKNWLRTFLTKAEVVESEGSFQTKFPEKLSFPSSAEIVSFNIFNNTSIFLDFLYRAGSISATMGDILIHSDFSSLSSSSNLDNMSNFLNCSRVFSSSTHRLIGFVMTTSDPLLMKSSEEDIETLNHSLVVVTKIYQWGIKWVSSVKFQHTNVTLGQEFEWSDFQFSGSLLVCLNSSGLIFVYDATTAEFVERLDVLHLCGLNLGPNPPIQAGNTCGRTIFFKRLIIASDLFLAAVDGNGVIYQIYPGDFTLGKDISVNKILPRRGLGVLVGWEVGGSDLSSCCGLYASTTTGSSLTTAWNAGNFNLGKKKKPRFSLSGFSSVAHIEDKGVPFSEVSSKPMRRIVLPVDGGNTYDSICFSPFGIIQLVQTCDMKDGKGFKIVHTDLKMDSTVHDDTRTNLISRKVGFVGEAVGCSFQGCFYLVTQDGLYVVLPSVSVRSSVLAVESVGYWQPNMCTDGVYQIENLFRTNKWDGHWPPWKMEVLDRVLLYEGPVEADHMCSQNGWNLKISRMRRLQFALDFLKSDEIEQSLQMLVDVDLAEEGILRLLFTIVYRIYCKVGNDNEYAIGSRLLALAACFATKMVRKYGLLQHKKDVFIFQGFIDSRISPSNDELNQLRNSRRLREMAHFLEVIRNLQRRLRENDRRPGQALVNDMDALSPVDTNSTQDVSCLPVLNVDTVSSEIQNQGQLALTTAGYNFDEEKLALIPMESFHHSLMPDLGNVSEVSVLSFQDGNLGRKMLPLENPKDMIARWEINNLDLKTVVKDALQSDRLPLAVLQLHLQRLRDLGTDKEPHDTFKEVRDVGRAIAYDLFLKGETRLAISTLQRLGDDIEISLKQLLFGTVRRSLRMQIAEEMNRYDYLTPYEWKILERISLIERLYLSSSFWRTFHGRPKELSKSPSSLTLLEENMLHLNLTCSHSFKDCIIECGEIDGVVTGPWENIDNRPAFLVVDEDNSYTGYWVAAAVWADAWDQRTIDRIVLDQPFLMGVHVLWESQLEYHVCHNDWEEVSKLLEMIPTYLLSNESLQINLDSVGSHGGQYSEELDVVLMNIPNIKILHFPVGKLCSTWLQMLMEQELAKSFIFLKKRWEGTVEILQLLARAGLIVKTPMLDSFIESSPDPGFSNFSEESHRDTVEAMHKLVIHYCTEYDLPNLLDLYLDHHKLVLEDDSLASLQAAAGDCEWAKWLLLSRIKGHEYDASFWNSRSIISRNVVQGTNLSNLEVDEIIQTVDDMAEGGGEMAALATLVFAPSPIQKFLCSGGVNRQFSSSAQCTLENLRPALQHFPSLWRTLIGSCFGQDSNGSPLGLNAKNIFGNSTLSDYLSWRENIFSASGRDTSLDQMLPCWFSKAIRRLVQLYVQGPLGWQSIGGISLGESFLHKDTDIFINAREHSEDSATSWEGTIQRNVEEELYASSVEENGFSVEHHLHRGHALAVLNHLLDLRTQKLKSGAILKKQSSGSSIHGQANIQVDVQTLLAPLTQSEESLLSSVIPLAIVHYEDSMLVASCAFLLELCGLSARMLQVDIAALRRISSFYRSSEYTEHVSHLSPKGSGDITSSLARALADHYMHHDERPSRALMAVLQHLENASLPLMIDGKTCGSWLLRGNGDETDIRFLQKAASEHWSLVTSFCQMHQIPLSTKYIAVLANDNDWVGFLTESQVGGYPFDVVVQEASKEFRDSRLKIHILTVLKSMHLARKKASSSSNSAPNGKTNEIDFSTKNDALVPVELFGLLAECERQKNPGETLLVRAKDLRWSLLAMIASCFPDVSPLSCLTVWLEITAARETSSITVNDIASQIATNVRAAVETTNSLSVHSRVLSFHYNRQNPKRRCLMEPTFSSPGTPSKASSTSGVVRFSLAQDITAEEKIKKTDEEVRVQSDRDEGLVSLTKMVGVLCEQRLFLPLLRAFEMFLPSCSLLPFIRALQAFSQMRLSEALAHLASFSGRIKDEPFHIKTYIGREGQIGAAWVSSTAVTAGDAILLTCPSAYEKRCLLQLLASTDFGDGGLASTRFRRFYWKINLAEPSLRKDDDLYLGNETLDDASLLTALEKKGHWEQARNWARQLESCGAPWRSALHHVTETQAEAMVAEWMEFLWDVPEERAALWGHCQTLFLRHSFPSLQAGLFFLKHAEAVEKDVPARELHEMLLLSLQWLSGTMTHSSPVYPLHLLREIETRVWLLAVESEAQVNNEGDFTLPSTSGQSIMTGNNPSIIERTASIITNIDKHLNTVRNRATEKVDFRENNPNSPSVDTNPNLRTKRRAKSYLPSRRSPIEADPDDGPSSPLNLRSNNGDFFTIQEENVKVDASASRWEERVGPKELERAVLSLLEFGQVAAAQQLQNKFSPTDFPSEFLLVDAALKLAAVSTPSCTEASMSLLDAEVLSLVESYNICGTNLLSDPLQVLESLATKCTEHGGRGLCKRIIAVVKAANILGLSFSEAFGKRPLEVLQLLSLKAQDSFEEAKLLVQTHTMPPASIAQILAESFLKGLLAAHRGGYMDSQKEEGPAPLLWRISDFMKWAELCPSEPEVGHALMRLVITGQEIPHACEVELLILSHHFYKSSSCLDGVDVLVALAATRVESYVSEGDFSCLARLVTGVSNFHALNFILGILIENGQLELLLQKYSAAETTTGTAEAVRGFRMAVLTSLKHFNPHDLDAFALVYNHFDMKHETASLLESRALQSMRQWFLRYDREQNEDLLESMRYFIEAAEVHSTIDAGNKTGGACAQASLLSLQIRMPDFDWLNLSETNARRALVEQSRFQEALIVAEAYNLNQPSEWALVLWNQMLKPELTEQFVAEFVAVLPLQPSMLVELARFYRAEVAARGDQSHFSVWLSPGGLPAEWLKHLGRSFRSLLKRTRDLRLQVQLATIATGFPDVVEVCMKVLDRVPDTAGPLVLRKGHGGAYLPLM